MRPTKQQRGFTLMEIVLAVTLAVGLMAAALLFYDQAMRVRTAVAQEVEASCAVRDVMDQITGELRSLAATSPLGEGLDGSDQELQMITAQLPGPAAWAVQKITEDPIPPEQDLRRVTYSIRETRQESGRTAIEGLQRTYQKLLTAAEAVEGREIVSEVICPGVQYLRFRYWARSDWVGSWTGGGPPLAVEITLGFRPLPAGTDPQDYPYETFRRVVYIPSSSGQAEGTVIRGRQKEREQ